MGKDCRFSRPTPATNQLRDLRSLGPIIYPHPPSEACPGQDMEEGGDGGLGWGGADRGEDERNGILTSTQQTSDKLFPDPPCSSGLHFPAASIQPQTPLPPWSHPPLGPASLLGSSQPGLVLTKSCLGFPCGSRGCWLRGIGPQPQELLLGSHREKSPTEAQVPPPHTQNPTPSLAPGTKRVSPPAPLRSPHAFPKC